METLRPSKIRLVIMADYCCYCWVGAKGEGTDLDNEFPEISGIDDMQAAFSAWNWKFEQHDPDDDGRVYAVDWESFHKEGIALCQRLKRLVGEAAEIYYWPPFEDVNGDSLGRIHIAADHYSKVKEFI